MSTRSLGATECTSEEAKVQRLWSAWSVTLTDTVPAFRFRNWSVGSRGSRVPAWKLPAVATPRLLSAKMRPLVSTSTPVLRLKRLEDRSATAAPLEASNSMPRLPPRSVRKSAPLALTSLTSSGSEGAAPARA